MSESDSTPAFRRINPAEVPGMFERLGITPIRGCYYLGRLVISDGGLIEPGYSPGDVKTNCGCALGLAAAIGVGSFDLAFGEDDGTCDALADIAGLDLTYARGLEGGWERGHVFPEAKSGSKDYVDGYADGRDAALACKAAGLHIVEL